MGDSLTATANDLQGDLKPICRIGVCLDQSSVGEQLMSQAMAVAQAFGAKLTIVHALEEPHKGPSITPADLLDWEFRRIQAQRYLESIQADFSTPGLPIDSQILEGRPAERIRDWVGGHDVDLTVLASHGVSGQTEWRLASTARKLVEGIPGSVLLVPSRPCQPHPKDETYNRVLVPLDGSPRAETALNIAATISEAHGAELDLFHVVPEPEKACPALLGDNELDLEQRLVDRNARAARVYLRAIAQRLGQSGVRVRTKVTVGDARREILRRIGQEHADLVVFSGHGGGALGQVPFGSVAGFLLENAIAPLLVVRDRTIEVNWTRPTQKSPSTSPRLPHATP